MKTIILKLILLSCIVACTRTDETEFKTAYELSGKTATATYQEIIEFYRQLADASPAIRLMTMGKTDAGQDLHLILFSASRQFDPAYYHEKKFPVWLINNGIHPGESCGIDACMLFFRDLVFNDSLQQMAQNQLIATIPVYNVGGALNRGKLTRANQVGPEAYGFRGNARNYDLNRDFIKADTRNARTFSSIFQFLDPDIFIDTHTSDGADFQHVMTYLSTQPDKMGEPMTGFMRSVAIPYLYEDMLKKGYPMIPYVQPIKSLPQQGISGFYDAPRYSTGYAALFQSFAFMSEAHMLKTYEQRVEATFQLLHSVLSFATGTGAKIPEIRQETRQQWQTVNAYPLQWSLDTARFSEIPFMGYRVDTVRGALTGAERIYFNKQEPISTIIPFYEFYNPGQLVQPPAAYLVPQSWHQLIDLLKLNRVEMQPLQKDSLMKVEAYRIVSYDTYPSAYEGHYPHYNLEVDSYTTEKLFRAGDYLIPVRQKAYRYILEVLEPGADDSWFKWNFFDPILSRKEYYSSYIFEDKAVEFLKENPDIQRKFQQKMQEDTAFAHNPREQLSYIYNQSPYFEESYLQYPVYRIH